MQVKITYNLPLDDVPEHVSELLENISERLKKLSQKTTNTATKVGSKQFSAATLAGTFGHLRDEVGYEAAKLNPPPPDEEPEPQQEPEKFE